MTDDDIRTVLLRDWDPLQIGTNLNLADEYDAFIPRIRNALDVAANVGDIEKELLAIEDYLHAPIFVEGRRAVASILLALKSP